MPKLIKGENLTPDQVKQVKAAFVHRPTVENNYPKRNVYQLRIPAVEDSQWLREHAFYFCKDGTLAAKPNYCEPYFMAE